MLAALVGAAIAVAWTTLDPGTGTALAVARAVRLGAVGAVTGLLVLVLVVWRPLRRDGAVVAAADDAFVRVGGRALRWFAVAGGIGALAALALLAADAGDALIDALGTRAGAWLAGSALAFAGLAVLGPTAVRGGAARSSRALTAALLLTVALNVAPAFGGHAAGASPAVALVPIEIVHVVAMGAWVGGLFGLLLVLPHAIRALPAGPDRTRLLAAVLLRFSPVALTAVVLLTLAGTGLSLLSLTTLYDLADTAYGRALFVKVVLLLVVIAIAVLQREYLMPRLEQAVAVGELPADDPPPEALVAARHVRTAVRGEALLLVVVLVVTGALAGYPTPKTLAGRPAVVERSARGLDLRLVAAPARTGDNRLRLSIRRADGRPAPERVLRSRAVPPGRMGSSDVPIGVTMTSPTRGRWTAEGVPLGARGTWKLEVLLEAPGGGRFLATLPVRVR
ncbi:MAG: CopD family protein [Patulibacter sp.]|nr:CopD family protein [Patulibacter sp.]